MHDYMNIWNLERPPPNAMWIYLWSIQWNVSFPQFHFKNAREYFFGGYLISKFNFIFFENHQILNESPIGNKQYKKDV
jgi:hypothetical protein